VPWNEPGIIMKMLDAGCYGIICPMINTAEEAQRFVGACRYPPKGYRSFGPTRVSLYAGADYAPNANDTVITMAMIETAQAVENLDAILDTPGLDGVYVGPADLSQSIAGKPQTDLTEPRLVEVLDLILAGCKKRGQVAGIHVASPAYGAQIINKGYQFVTIVSDGRLMANACQQVLGEIRGAAPSAAAKAEGPY
jgi:4-hydroxy-2-oxoheptanedioate aldolase